MDYGPGGSGYDLSCRVDDQLQCQLQIQSLIQGPADGCHGLAFLQAALGVFVLPRVADGNRRPVGGGFQEALIVGGERVGLGVYGLHHADHFTAQIERYGQQ